MSASTTAPANIAMTHLASEVISLVTRLGAHAQDVAAQHVVQIDKLKVELARAVARAAFDAEMIVELKLRVLDLEASQEARAALVREEFTEVLTPAASTYVCGTCSDTHRTPSGALALCTRCPVPCQACRGFGGRGPYCSATPCACECHLARKFIETTFSAGAK